MGKDELTAKVLEVFSSVLPEINTDELDLSAPLVDSYGVNSVTVIQFIVGLEKELNIEFEDSELALGLYYDMNDMINKVAAKLG